MKFWYYFALINFCAFLLHYYLSPDTDIHANTHTDIHADKYTYIGELQVMKHCIVRGILTFDSFLPTWLHTSFFSDPYIHANEHTNFNAYLSEYVFTAFSSVSLKPFSDDIYYCTLRYGKTPTSTPTSVR